MAADYVVTEAGGFQMPNAKGPRLPVIVGEKGSYWCRITVRGTPGHASQPFRTDNALVTAAEIVRRLAEYRPPTMIHDTWRRFIEGVDFGPEWNARLLDEATLHDFCEELPIGLARQAHACTHTTFAPTIIHGGTKTNVIPDLVDVEVDIRTLPGQTSADIRKMLADALGDLCRARRDHAVRRERVDVVADRHAIVGRDGPGLVGARRGFGAGAVPDRRRDRRSVLPPQAARSRTASGCSAASSRSTTTRRCSTATTNASTPNHSSCRRDLWHGLAHDLLGLGSRRWSRR